LEWQGEGDDEGKGTGVVDEVNEGIVTGRDCDVGSKMAGGRTVGR